MATKAAAAPKPEKALVFAWEGTDRGHGRLTMRRVILEASGKAVYGMTTQIEIVDDGTNPVRVVPGLGATPAVFA